MSNLTNNDIKLLISALHDAEQWQYSIEDTHYHSIMPHYRTEENTKEAIIAEKMRKKYFKLREKLAKKYLTNETKSDTI
jgi:hypothetical protein